MRIITVLVFIHVVVTTIQAAETLRINAAPQTDFAARELQRFIYLRTGTLAAFTEPAEAAIQLIADSKDLTGDEYELEKQGSTLTVKAGNTTAMLYGVYRLLEHYGIRFYMHGDVIPDTPVPFTLPTLNKDGKEKHKPLFALRGVNPWGSHPQGFDQWSADDYIVHIGQLAKMRMNFIGIHCYPEALPYAEPTVWLGEEKNINPDGTVRFSYPSHYFSTGIKGHWGGIAPKAPADYLFGGDKLFPPQSRQPDVMRDCPAGPQTPEECNELFNRTGQQFAKAFTFAKQLGVKTCIGTEAPLTIPKSVNEKDVKTVYKAIFKRIQAAHPLDYYWIWTNENWTWHSNKPEETAKVIDDILIAAEALKEAGSPFELATAGWVVGPAEDRALLDKKLPADISISSISRNVGHTPVDAAYKQITRAKKWAIPWLESDTYHGLNNPQIFVGRTFKDAADAKSYGCNGLMGLHWRTEELSPNFAALAQAGWDSVDAKKDFWKDWCQNMFGENAAEEAAAVFAAVDGKLPVSIANDCPCGKLAADNRHWADVSGQYAFVDEFVKLESKMETPGCKERFWFWKNFLLFYRQQAQFRCQLHVFNESAKAVEAEKDAAMKKQLAEKELVAAFGDLQRSYAAMSQYLQETVTTNGGLMEIVFMEQSSVWRKLAFDEPKRRFETLTGTAVTVPNIREYAGRARIFVPTLRTTAYADEKIMLPVKIHTAGQLPVKAVLYWKDLGNAKMPFEQIALTHLNGSNYEVQLPVLNEKRKAVEYYIEAALSGQPLRFPAAGNGTVILL
ncbi:MAG: hypothetical protein LBT46_03595 [Planctomycetaceae bacterium]|nr:hypothetical protein [Planctomycetaceae bacterium]